MAALFTEINCPLGHQMALTLLYHESGCRDNPPLFLMTFNVFFLHHVHEGEVVFQLTGTPGPWLVHFF